MKPNYKNWVPDGMKKAMYVVTTVALILLFVFGILGMGVHGTVRIALAVFLGMITVVCGWYSWWCNTAYKAFDYDGKRKLSKQIIEGIASYIDLPDGGRGLDVGCGSGALTIACAKRNPKAAMLGVDRWGKDYASFSKPLCESNSVAEGVKNTSFQQADAMKLPFEDESFDVVTSNYVYHNITGVDKQKLLLETFRVLKKGGTFAIHDLMSKARYGDMDVFIQKLKDMGYEKVELIDTTDHKFMEPEEAKQLMLGGSSLLVGRK